MIAMVEQRCRVKSLAGVVFFGEKFAKAIELAFPGGAVIANPLLESVEAGGLDAAGSYTAELFGVHEGGLFEDLQMLRDGGKRDAKRFGEARYGHGAAGEAVEDRTARGIPEGVKQSIDLLRR
jgi:hypothetical protein